jgi:uncharacterized ParB-like nuclease family protein
MMSGGDMPDGLIERLLAEMGIEYTIADIDVGMVDKEISKLNHGRINPIQRETVEDYAAAMKRGEPFPMGLYRRTSGKKPFQILSGCHRFEAKMMAGERRLKVYLVEVDDLTASEIAMKANQLNGVRTTRDEQIKQGVKLVTLHGMTSTAAAQKLNLKESTLKAAVQAEKARDQMTQAWGINVDQVAALSATSVLKLCLLAKTPAVMRAAAEYVAKKQLDGPETSELVSEIELYETEAEKLECVRKKLLAKRQPTANERPNRAHLMRVLANVAKLKTRIPTRQMMQLTQDDLTSGAFSKLLQMAEEELARVKSLLGS